MTHYHLVGPPWLAVRGAWNARRLLHRTRRLIARDGYGVAGRALVQVPAARLRGVEVDCDRVGLRWRLAPFDVAQRTMFALGVFDHRLVEWIMDQLRAGDRVIDVGAHVGLFSVQFGARLRELGGGSVVAFEPAPDSVEKLRRHVALNDLGDIVEVVPTALGSRAATMALRGVAASSADDPSLRSLLGSGVVAGGEVAVCAFDEWWNQHGQPPFDVVKIDVEGFELEVVEGMTAALRTAAPRLLIVEIKEHLNANAGRDTRAVRDALAALGYDEQGPFSSVVGAEPMAYLDDNIVFVRRQR